jgi:hypothetical protein
MNYVTPHAKATIVLNLIIFTLVTEYKIQVKVTVIPVLMNKHHGDDLAFGMGQVLTTPYHRNLHNTSQSIRPGLILWNNVSNEKWTRFGM